MLNRLFRKVLVLAVIVLFVGASILPSIGSLSVKMHSNLVPYTVL